MAGFGFDGEVKFITNCPARKGEIEELPGEDRFAVYSDQGAWLYDGEGELICQIIDKRVEKFLWDPGGEYFFILTDENQAFFVGNAYDDYLALVDTGVSKSYLGVIR